MKKYQSIIVFAILLVAIVSFPAFLSAQAPFDPPNGGGAPLGGPVGVPIDGGLSALIVAGVALIARKFWKNKKNTNANG